LQVRFESIRGQPHARAPARAAASFACPRRVARGSERSVEARFDRRAPDMDAPTRAPAEDAQPIPVLPVRCTQRSKTFYARLGFRTQPDGESEDYLVLRAGVVELHFFRWPDLAPAGSSALAHVRVRDADALWRAWARLGIPGDGAPRLTAPADTPWGLRRFALVDPDGNCLSFEHAGGTSG
jgi:catechol 2,3-dioxygenase-like lactoylglutathione lyase family enzyme